jgi:two-component system, LuxR family, sensor kinase FixL
MQAMFSRETQALMEAAVDAVIVIDHHGVMTAVNEAATRTFGYRIDEMLGQNVSLLMPEQDRERHDGYLAKYLDTGRAKIIGIGREVTAQRKDGSVFPARLSVGRVPESQPPRFVGLLRDVSAEHEATAALKLERDRAQAYLELNDSILLMLDDQHRIREINTRGADLLGAARDDIRGRDWLELMRDDTERERALLMLASARSTAASREREFDAVDFSGQRLRLYWRCIARRAADGTPAGWLISGLDVTERAHREEQALLAQSRFTRVARLATMGEMAAGVAHELNQPLAAITTYARACERYLDQLQPDLEEIREAVCEIGAEGLRAARAIDLLRQLVRQDELDPREPLEINAVIEDLRAWLATDARLFDAHLDLALGQCLPRIRGNAVQLQQVVLNLVRNALEALSGSPPDERRVSLTTSSDAGEVCIHVTDNGPGIPPEIADRLFHPFATTKQSGTGLGLAMSRTIVQAHGGTIGTRVVDPHGLCVFFTLPALENKVA